MLIPYAVDVPCERRPFVNWLILFVILAIFGLQVAVIHYSPSYEEYHLGPFRVKITDHPFYEWFLTGWNIKGLLGHMWIHGGWLHLIGNMLFLWLFGNAICAKVGNLRFILIYLILGFASAAAHVIFCGGAAIGASGAINGVVGMFLVFFPQNDISCVWIFWFPLLIRPYVKAFSVSSYWVILMWFVFDVWGAVKGTGNVAYAAHVGGFVMGFVIAIVMLKLKWVTVERYEKSLLQLLGLEKTESYFDDYFDPIRNLQPWMGDAIKEQANQDSKSVKLGEQALAEPPPAVAAARLAGAEGQDEFIKIVCQCGKKVKFPVKYAGKMGRCPACGSRINITVPGVKQGGEKEKNCKNEENFIRFSCKCGKRMKVSQKYSGRIVKCPVCQNRVKIP